VLQRLENGFSLNSANALVAFRLRAVPATHQAHAIVNRMACSHCRRHGRAFAPDHHKEEAQVVRAPRRQTSANALAIGRSWCGAVKL